MLSKQPLQVKLPSGQHWGTVPEITAGEHQLKLESETSHLLNALAEKWKTWNQKKFLTDELKMTAFEQFIV